jgi:hypothetical protein
LSLSPFIEVLFRDLGLNRLEALDAGLFNGLTSLARMFADFLFPFVEFFFFTLMSF